MECVNSSGLDQTETVNTSENIQDHVCDICLKLQGRLLSRGREKLPRAKVLYSYNAENDDELDLEEGDILDIVDMELEDNGWWKGQLDGKVGVFPDNFVELLPAEPARPRKPPPPAAPQHENGKKLPEKPAPPEPAKKTKEEAPRPVPSLPSKKPSAVPPPVGKKPKPITDDDKAREKEPNLDSVEPSTEKLTHMTAGRAQVPTKRPPSKRFNNPPEVEEEAEVPVPLHEAQPPLLRPIGSKKGPVKSRRKSEEIPEESPPPILERAPKEESARPMRRPPPPKDMPKSPNKTPEPAVIKSPRIEEEPTKEPSVDPAMVEDLKKEIADLKENTVSLEQYDTLLDQVTQLKEQFSQIKSKYDKRIKDLMGDVDEGKKNRLNMQVEIDRLKKLVDE